MFLYVYKVADADFDVPFCIVSTVFKILNVCHLPFPESGENLPMTLMSGIFAWWTFPNTKIKGQEKNSLSKYSFIYFPVNHSPELPILNLQQSMLYHQPHRKMTMQILRLTLSVPAKILIFRIKMNWMI